MYHMSPQAHEYGSKSGASHRYMFIMLHDAQLSLCAAALQQVIQNDPVDNRLEAVLAPALAPVLAYMSRTPAFSDAITAVAAVNSTLVGDREQQHV